MANRRHDTAVLMLAHDRQGVGVGCEVVLFLHNEARVSLPDLVTDVMRRKFAALNAQDGEEMMKHFSPEAQKEIPGAILRGSEQIAGFVSAFWEGLIVSSHLHFDRLTLLKQLGVAPAAAPA